MPKQIIQPVISKPFIVVYLMNGWCFTLLAIILVSGGAHAADDVRFCGLGRSLHQEESVATRIDFSRRMVFGEDVAQPFRVVENHTAIGMVVPIPLSIPKRRLSAAETPLHWRLGGYRFTATTLNAADPDWLLIHATPMVPRSKTANTDSSSVLYSQSSGVIAIRIGSILSGKTVADELYSCGGKRILPSSFLPKDRK